jgi:uncharacterized NAD-dependent epimerase/dehydratase family protein
MMPQKTSNLTDAVIIAHGYLCDVLKQSVHGDLLKSKVFNIVALVDREKAGMDLSEICPDLSKATPVYDTIHSAILHKPKVVIFVGDPSVKNLEEIKFCISKGIDIINSSFVFLNDFPELLYLAKMHGVRIIDLRDAKKLWTKENSPVSAESKELYARSPLTETKSSSVIPYNPFTGIYQDRQNVILLAHGLMGTVRSKSANGLMMHSQVFNVVGIIDKKAVGKDTSLICPGISVTIPIYSDAERAIENHKATALILLISPSKDTYSDVSYSIKAGLDIINTSFKFIKDNPFLVDLVKQSGTRYFDLRDVASQQAYPNINILNRKAKVVFVTGTDCGLGKRTAAYELTLEARKKGINAVMYATGQTGLMLGERGTVIDALIVEFSNGIISQHVTRFNEEGYELIFVEGQSDIYHPANSAMSLALLHGANPDCIVLVHDETRKVHKGFEEDSPLYQMHSVKKYIETLENLSLPCGPVYKTVGIATIGNKNIKKIGELLEKSIPVSDVRQTGGSSIILDAVLKHLEVAYGWCPVNRIFAS